jgi:transposase
MHASQDPRDSGRFADDRRDNDSPHAPTALPKLTTQGRARVARRLLFIVQVGQGLSIPEALRRARLNITERSARQLLHAYRRDGDSALIDRRSLVDVPARNPRRTRTEEVERIVRSLSTESGHRIAQITRLARVECLRLGLPIPSQSTVRRILGGSPASPGTPLAARAR